MHEVLASPPEAIFRSFFPLVSRTLRYPTSASEEGDMAGVADRLLLVQRLERAAEDLSTKGRVLNAFVRIHEKQSHEEWDLREVEAVRGFLSKSTRSL